MNKPKIAIAIFALGFFALSVAGCTAEKVSLRQSALASSVIDGKRGQIHEWALDNNASAILSLRKGDPRINVGDENGWTPLHWAAEFGNAEAVEALLSRGANIGARIKTDSSEVSKETRRIAIEKGLYSAEKLEGVSWTNTGETALHLAAYSGNRRVITALLEAGADIYQRNMLGESPLHAAAWADKDRVVYELVSRGALVDARGEQGETPMHKAAGSGSIAVIHELAVQGANMDSRDKDAATPMHWAVRYDRPDAMVALHSRGADIEARSVDGYTPLHWAVNFQNYKAIIMLLQMRADINARADDGDTSLHLATRNNDVEAIEGLCKLGANADNWDINGDTPLHHAVANNPAELTASAIRILIQSLIQSCDADVNSKNRFAQTPLDLAIDKDNRAAIEELLEHNAQRGPES